MEAKTVYPQENRIIRKEESEFAVSAKTIRRGLHEMGFKQTFGIDMIPNFSS